MPASKLVHPYHNRERWISALRRSSQYFLPSLCIVPKAIKNSKWIKRGLSNLLLILKSFTRLEKIMIVSNLNTTVQLICMYMYVAGILCMVFIFQHLKYIKSNKYKRTWLSGILTSPLSWNFLNSHMVISFLGRCMIPKPAKLIMINKYFVSFKKNNGYLLLFHIKMSCLKLLNTII